MTELRIDNKAVVLPDEFSWELSMQNPVFTKNGTFTLEVELSLIPPQNALLYSHLNRVNNTAIIPENRSAYITVDNEVILNGMEIVLEITESKVKIQLASGESELNFLMGGDRKINSLKINFDMLQNSEWAIFPVYSNTKEKFIGTPDINIQDGTDTPYLYWHSGNILRHVRLYAFMNKILASLNYRVKENVIRTHEKWRYLYIVNNAVAGYFRCYADWTITEFFEEIEKLFNVIFLIDEYDKSVSVVFKRSYYSYGNKIYVENAIDDYVQKPDRENKTDYSAANIGYDLDDTVYYAFQNIPEKILESASFFDPANDPDYGSYAWFKDVITQFAANDSPLTYAVFTSTATGTNYISYKEDRNGNPCYYPKKVLTLKPIKNNPGSDNIDILCKIIPADMGVFDLPVYKLGIEYRLRTQMPRMDTFDVTVRENENETINIQETVEGDPEQSSDRSLNKMYLVFYDDYHTVYKPGAENNTGVKEKIDYPVPFVDFLWEFNEQTERKISENNLSLRLDDPNGLKQLYNDSLKIDTTREYVFTFLCRQKPDVKNIFVIKNKEFVCKELKYRINAKGAEPAVEGIFYAVQ